MKRLKINYYQICIFLGALLLTASIIFYGSIISHIGITLAIALSIYGIVGSLLTIFVKKCILCTSYFISKNHELCESCRKTIDKIEKNTGYYEKHPNFSEEIPKPSETKKSKTSGYPSSNIIK